MAFGLVRQVMGEDRAEFAGKPAGASPQRRSADSERDHQQFPRAYLAAFIAAYNFATRLETLSGLTTYEHIRRTWTEKPKFFRNTNQRKLGLCT